MARKRNESQRACKEWAPSVKLLQPNINRIIHAKIKSKVEKEYFW